MRAEESQEWRRVSKRREEQGQVQNLFFMSLFQTDLCAARLKVNVLANLAEAGHHLAKDYCS